MKHKQIYLFSLVSLALLLGFSGSSYGQSWSGMIAPARAIDWTQAGVAGGIPSGSWTQCGATIAPYSGSAAAISNALAGCSANTYVLLGAGTFNLSSGIVMVSNVTLRGAGANSTFLVFTGANNCNGEGADVCFMGENTYYGSPWIAPGGTQAATWTAGYSAGTTSITLTNVGSAGLAVGQYIFLDQANDSSDNGNFFVCDNTSAPCSLEGGSPGRNVGGVDRNQVQMVKITGISGSTYTITPGLYAPNWRSSQAPGAWWPAVQLHNAGIENLSMDHTNGGGEYGVIFFNAFNCWVSGVRSLNANRDHVDFWQAAHDTIQNSYFYGTLNGMSQSYGVESFISSDDLVVNNIFQHVTAPIMMGPAQGSVFIDNFTINDFYYVAGWMQQALANGHDAGALYNLFEGNSTSGTWADVFHGTSGFNTMFRNRLVGWESGKTGDTAAAQVYSYNRYLNFIGNVMGQPGYTTNYQTSAGVGASATIFDLGSGNTEGSTTVPSDSNVAATMLRWGNYDTVNGAVRWSSSEVPSGIGLYANSIPASHTLAASLFYSSKPSWWPSGKAWPAIGPDVTGGNVSGVGGFAYTIPAQDCYLSVMGGPADGSGNALTFNPTSCYGQAVVQAPPASPAPPTNLSAVPH